ncbi:hypothetical protein CRE_17466 [Caenorhabditis remanei]|uniref:DUF38 domain-containing protein n=1 Tax=Caenorhabditis remanei TaxID=31234 RepID=E3N270_CAERE|nr:hypothetical protein CRE_17466 [Caenorhabditis remanei]
MSLPLSYPGLKCVLENLEAVKRVHIIGRSPGLQKIDKLIPLRLKDFYVVDSTKMIINDLTINYYKDEVVEFEMHPKTSIRQRAESQGEKMKKLINYYFCERSIIHVGELCWLDPKFHAFLPVDLKFRVNSLTAAYRQHLDTAILFIDPRSFPLKILTTYPDTLTFDNQVVKSAEILIFNLFMDRIVTVEELKKLSNKKVEVELRSSSRIDIIPLIKYHVETKKVIETTFIISTGDKDFIDMMFSEFELAFSEFKCDLDDVNERFLPGSSRFSIPINNESRIKVYAIENPEEDCPYQIIVKPVSIET